MALAAQANAVPARDARSFRDALGRFATGVALLVVGPGGGIVLGLHKASFVIWGGAFAIHVLAYALRVPGLVGADWGRGRGTSSRWPGNRTRPSR